MKFMGMRRTQTKITVIALVATIMVSLICTFLIIASQRNWFPFSPKPHVIALLPPYIDFGAPAMAQIGQPIKFTLTLSNDGIANAVISSITSLEVEENGGHILNFNIIPTVPSPSFEIPPQNSKEIEVTFQPEDAITTKEVYLEIIYRPGYKTIKTPKITLQWY
jgi:hypothetical protein